MPDTIFALSSGALPSGVAIIRLSGVLAKQVARQMTGLSSFGPKLVLSDICDPQTNTVLDRGLVCGFTGPHSYTGEDVIELHCHGGRATVSAILTCLGDQLGCRPAQAGEFSKRAFENGKMDLTALEGLSDLIAAETEGQRIQALRQSGGDLRTLYDGWRSQLIRCRALIEAELDFSDEEDIPDSVSDQVWSAVESLTGEISNHLDDGQIGEIIREGYRIALLGPPNAGKSSVLNALAQRDVAIVTPIAGTTRDTIDVDFDIRGFKVIVTDTAGLRATDDIVEREGILRAERAARTADLVLWLQPPENSATEGRPTDAVTLHTKSDLMAAEDSALASKQLLTINTTQAHGLDDLLTFIEHCLADLTPKTEQSVVTRHRHRAALTHCLSLLNSARNSSSNLEISSEYLRLAGDCLGRITGRVDVEDLLDVIFSEFCVGK